MVFRYDPNKLNVYRKNNIVALIPPFFFSTIFILLVLYFQMRESENALFIILITFTVMIVVGTISSFMGYKKAADEFNSYKIECNDHEILITSKTISKSIKFEKITKVFKDHKNNIYVVSNMLDKTKIQSYIANIEELENILSNVSPIEYKNYKYNFLQFLPLILFFGLRPISRLGSIELYLIFAVIVLLAIIYSLIKSFLDQTKLKYKIFGILINGIMVIFLVRHIYMGIKFLIN